MSEQIQRIEEKLDALISDFHDHRVQVESRITKIEVKASLLGIIAGALGGVVATIFGNK